MNFKVLFTVFLCLLSAFVICNVARVVNAVEGWSCKTFTYLAGISYVTTNGIEPTGGDERPGPPWPT